MSGTQLDTKSANDIYKDGRFQACDWTYLGEDEALPAAGAVFVPLEVWRASADALRGRNAPTGVVVEAGEDIRALATDIAHVAAVAVRFPKFSDGRGYSTARILREELSFTGEIRAIGDVLIDQIALMRRCGFDAFAVTHVPTRASLEGNGVPDVVLHYQPVESAREIPAGARPWMRRQA